MLLKPRSKDRLLCSTQFPPHVDESARLPNDSAMLPLKSKELCSLPTWRMASCSSFLTCDSRVTWLRRRTLVVSGIAIFQDSFILCGSLVFVRTEEAPSPTYIKIRVVCPLMQREALARIKADFTLQRVKGNFFQGLIWLLIIWAGLQKEKHWCLFQRQK